MKKNKFEDIKRTAKAHGTLSEKVAEKKAEKVEEITEKAVIELEEEEFEKWEQAHKLFRGMSVWDLKGY